MFNDQEVGPIFDLREVCFTYDGPPSIEALRGVDLQIYPGEYVAIIGANGSGKSTLARLLNALLLPTRGRVWAAGIPTDDATRRAEIRRAAQMVFQQPDFQIVATTVEEDVAFGPENFGVPEDQLVPRVQAALEAVGMWEQRSRPPHMLSAGQKQRVAIAGALAVQPRALILDEATAMLDPAGRAAVLGILRQLHQQGTTMITITHEMDEAAEAERVIVLDHGEVILDGPPEAVFAQAEQLREHSLDVPLLAGLALHLGLPVCLTAEALLEALGPPPAARGGAEDLSGAEENPIHPPHTLNEAMIEVQDLHYTYMKGTPLAVIALQGVDLHMGRGALCGLIGQTGSGKSTLMQHLNGLMRPQAGHVIVDGKDWADPTLEVRSARFRVGFLFQQPEDQLFERYVGDDVAYGPRQMKRNPAEVRQHVQEAMEVVGLPFEDYKDRLTRSLSGGEQRRAALAGVLALRPLVLVADEPTAGLDPQGRAQILEIFRRLHQDGVTILIGSHRMEDIIALCDQVFALKDGRVAIEGPAREVFADPEKIAQFGLQPPALASVGQSLSCSLIPPRWPA